MIKLLPKWNLHGNRPSFYDTDSVTLLELASRLHGSMNEIITDYNAFADRINGEISSFMTSTNKDLEAFETAMRQEFQDFIDVINLKYNAQEEIINNAISGAISEIENYKTYLLGELEKVDDIISSDIQKWLDEHPEATSTVQEKSLELRHFSDDLKIKAEKDYYTPEMFGYKTGEDCTAIAQNILDTYGNLRLLNKTYTFNGGLTITKTRSNFICDDGVTINYTGTGDFITIGTSEAYAFYPRLRNLYIFAPSARAAIRILGMSGGYFENVICFGQDGGQYGFAYNEDVEPYHLITSTFIKCGAHHFTKSGFHFSAEWAHQVNDITLIECTSNGNGEYGFNIGGNAVNMCGGNVEGNTRGIALNGTCNGINIIGTYSEANTEYDWYLPKEADAKKNILVSNTYDLSKKVYSEYDVYKELFHRNIQFTTTRADFHSAPFKNNKHVVYNSPLSVAVRKLRGTKIANGSKINVKMPKDKFIDPYGKIHLYRQVNIDGVVFNHLKNAIIRQVVIIEDGVCTFDSPLDLKAYYAIPYENMISSKLFTREECVETKSFMVLESGDSSLYNYHEDSEQILKYDAEEIPTPIESGGKSASLPFEVNVGDYVVFINNVREYTNYNVHPTDPGEVKTSTISINTDEFHPFIKENLCIGILPLSYTVDPDIEFMSIT